MTQWPKKPFIYQINTAVWLDSLSHHYDEEMTLATLPDEVLGYLAALNVDAIWLMGVWQRSAAGRESALNYTHEYRPVLPDLTDDDVIGSAYAIGAYEVDTRWGGPDALAQFRQRLKTHGLRLLLDYVPNHVATDHPWVTEKPHYMVRVNEQTYKNHPGMFFKTTNTKGQKLMIAHGRDPYFPSWIDTAQVNAFSPEYRQAAVQTLLDIASQCDGVRCDMAMLMVNSIFSQTWGAYLMETAPNVEFWDEVIPAVKAQYPHFVFAAEVYWDMEHQLQEQGFDFTYDKLLYDRLEGHDVQQIKQHLSAELQYQQRMVRFIENHDEPRAAASMGVEKSRAAAVVVATTPGATLLHDGQFMGRYIKLPVQISRQPNETPHHALSIFYKRLLQETRHPVYQEGEWTLFDVEATDHWGVDTHNHILAYGWKLGQTMRLILVNLTPVWVQGVVCVHQWHDLLHTHWCLRDALGGGIYYRNGNEIHPQGLYMELEPFQSCIFHLGKARNEQEAQYFIEMTPQHWPE